MTTGKIKLKKKVLGDELFLALMDSEYMEKQGYEVEGGPEFKIKHEKVYKPAGIEYVLETPTKEVKTYKMFYGKHAKGGGSYIHMFNIKPGNNSVFNFLITLEAPYTMSDLENLVEELNQKFDK